MSSQQTRARFLFLIPAILSSFLAACGGAESDASLAPGDTAGETSVQAERFPEAFPGRTGLAKRGAFIGPNGRFEAGYREIDGRAVVEKDLVLDLAPPAAPGDDSGVAHPESVGRNSPNYRWANGIVPFDIDGNLTGTDLADAWAGINYWNANTAFWLRPRNGEADYVHFFYDPAAGCYSNSVGRKHGKQTISIHGCPRGGSIHEIGHAIGLFQEQSRSDRDLYVNIYWNNIKPGDEINFESWTQSGTDGRDMFAFDFNSLMLYGNYEDAINRGEPTILKKDGTLWTHNLTGLSSLDMAGAFRELSYTDGSTTFRLKNAYTGQCLTADPGRTLGGQVWQQACGVYANQYWYFWTPPGNSTVVLANAFTGMCLDIPYGQTQLEGPVNQYDCNAHTNQQWTLGYNNWGFTMKNAASGTCLFEYQSGSAGLEQYACGVYQDESWYLDY